MINVHAPINKLGYGYVGYNFIKHMDCFVYPIGKVEVDSADGIQEKFLLNKYSPFNNTLKIYHQHSLFERVGNGTYTAFPIFELDRFTEQELYSLSTPDKIVVCSEWARRILTENNLENGHVVNLGIDPSIFNREGVEQGKNRPYVFFNAGKWETRKGHDVLIKAFLNAFSVKDNVELWMMPTNPFLSVEEDEEWRRKYTAHKLWSKIKLLPRVSTQADMAAIIKRVDCGVFPARAEGWGLEGLECLACGKELITTNYSGHTEYATVENSHLIEFRYLEPAIGQNNTEKGWFKGQGNWGSFDVEAMEQLVDHLKYCYRERPAKNKADYSKFSWANLAPRLERIVSE